MNPLIRLCGFKCRHGERDLSRRAQVLDSNRLVLDQQMMADSFAAVRVPRSARIILPRGLVPTCGTQGQRVRWAADPIRLSFGRQTGEGQRRMVRGHGPDDVLIGGALVVVRDRENLLHGEGEQFKHVCGAH